MTLHVAVIGAGIVGVSCAIELIRDGHQVTLIEEAEAGGRQAASYGNGSWISPASVVPMSMPGLWRKVPGYLRDATAPLTIRSSAVPRLLPWLLRFVLAGATVRRVEGIAAALRPLLENAPEHHLSLAAESGTAHLLRRSGLLYVYPGRGDFQAESLAWRLRRDNGVRWVELDREALRRREPALSGRYELGVLVEAGAHCLDTGSYVAGLAQHAYLRGAAAVRTGARGFRIENGRLRAVRTDRGEILCDRAVIAAGMGSRSLARAAGDRVSLESERGYHVVVSSPEAAPYTPLMPSDGKMANTMTLDGLRAAGQVELASPDAEPDWRRADILLAHLRRTYPALPAYLPEERLNRWMGHRPSTPDGLPVLGPSSATSDIVHAFGHGHVGFAAGPTTGRAVADILGERPSALPLAAYAADRFTWRRSLKAG